MLYHQWLSSPFSYSALKDMESGLLTVTSIDVMNFPPLFTWSGFWLHQYKSLQHILPSHLLLLYTSLVFVWYVYVSVCVQL